MEVERLIEATFIQSWTTELQAMSVPAHLIPLTKTEVKNLCELMWDGYPNNEIEARAMRSAIDDLQRRITNAAVEFLGSDAVEGKGFLAKLGSQSVKAARDVRFPFYNGEDVLVEFLSNMRVFDALIQDLRANRESYIVLYPYFTVSSKSTFRIFVKNGHPAAISQYAYKNTYEWVIDHQAWICRNLNEFGTRAAHASGLNDLIIDVFFDANKPYVLEIYPYLEFIDPCLFTWDEIRSLDGSQPVFKFTEPTIARDGKVSCGA